MKSYNWATLGCGVIANELAAAMEKRGQKLYSVANRTHQKAVEFAQKYGIEKVYNDIDELFAGKIAGVPHFVRAHSAFRRCRGGTTEGDRADDQCSENNTCQYCLIKFQFC